jgi:hypothetical protein
MPIGPPKLVAKEAVLRILIETLDFSTFEKETGPC